jgi:hypothetical protein
MLPSATRPLAAQSALGQNAFSGARDEVSLVMTTKCPETPDFLQKTPYSTIECRAIKVPYLTVSQIENDTCLLLNEFEQCFGKITAPPINVEGIIESLFQLDLRFADLKSSLGDDVLGATWILEREVRVEETLDPTVDERKEGALSLHPRP